MRPSTGREQKHIRSQAKPTFSKKLEYIATALQESPAESPGFQSPWNVSWRYLRRMLNLLALYLACGLIQGIPQDGVLLLQAG